MNNAKTVLEILDTEEKQQILIHCFQQYINKCKKLANAPLRGYGTTSEIEKKKAWKQKFEEAQLLLSDIVMELN